MSSGIDILTLFIQLSSLYELMDAQKRAFLQPVYVLLFSLYHQISRTVFKYPIFKGGGTCIQY